MSKKPRANVLESINLTVPSAKNRRKHLSKKEKEIIQEMDDNLWPSEEEGKKNDDKQKPS